MTFDLAPFSSWLLSRSYSEATVRNYVNDINRYLEYVRHLPEPISYNFSLRDSFHILSPEVLQKYVAHISDKISAGRYLASLNLFCQFAVDQKLVSQNPFKALSRTKRNPGLSGMVDRWEQYLIARKTAPATIRNYINDLNQYISWLDATASGPQ